MRRPSPRAADKTPQHRDVQVPNSEAAGALVGGIQHHADEAGRGQGGGEGEIRRLVGHQHRHQSDAATHDGCQVAGQRTMVAAGDEAELDEVHAGVRRASRRFREQAGPRRQIADGGADRSATADESHRVASAIERPSAQGAATGSLRSIRSTPTASASSISASVATLASNPGRTCGGVQTSAQSAQALG